MSNEISSHMTYTYNVFTDLHGVWISLSYMGVLAGGGDIGVDPP